MFRISGTRRGASSSLDGLIEGARPSPRNLRERSENDEEKARSIELTSCRTGGNIIPRTGLGSRVSMGLLFPPDFRSIDPSSRFLLHPFRLSRKTASPLFSLRNGREKQPITLCPFLLSISRRMEIIPERSIRTNVPRHVSSTTPPPPVSWLKYYIYTTMEAGVQKQLEAPRSRRSIGRILKSETNPSWRIHPAGPNQSCPLKGRIPLRGMSGD